MLEHVANGYIETLSKNSELSESVLTYLIITSRMLDSERFKMLAEDCKALLTEMRTDPKCICTDSFFSALVNIFFTREQALSEEENDNRLIHMKER